MYLDMVEREVDKIRRRLAVVTKALDEAGVPYAVIGGNAVAAWVSTADESFVRFTKDVDILLRRNDLDAAERALSPLGFIRRRVAGIEMFLDGPNARARDGVHVIFAGERVRPDSVAPAPDVDDIAENDEFRLISLLGLVTLKLTSNRDVDRTHLRDMIAVGLIDESWAARFAEPLRGRLQHLFDTPGG